MPDIQKYKVEMCADSSSTILSNTGEMAVDNKIKTFDSPRHFSTTRKNDLFKSSSKSANLNISNHQNNISESIDKKTDILAIISEDERFDVEVDYDSDDNDTVQIVESPNEDLKQIGIIAENENRKHFKAARKRERTNSPLYNSIYGSMEKIHNQSQNSRSRNRDSRDVMNTVDKRGILREDVARVESRDCANDYYNTQESRVVRAFDKQQCVDSRFTYNYNSVKNNVYDNKHARSQFNRSSLPGKDRSRSREYKLQPHGGQRGQLIV